MVTRRRWSLAALCALAAPSAAFAQPSPAPLTWRIVVDSATYTVSALDPPALPAPPGRLSVHYEWEEDDKIEQWWQAILNGHHDPKTILLYVLRGNGKGKNAKAIIKYALGGVQLAAFKGPALSPEGGYSGPSTAIMTFASVRVLPK
jgi:hypothetical protein